MAVSEVTNALMRELEVSHVLDLSPDFYEKVKKAIASLEERGEKDEVAKYEAILLKKTVERLFLLRISKIINYMIRESAVPRAVLPKEERAVIKAIKSQLDSLLGEEVIEAEVEKAERIVRVEKKTSLKVLDGVLVVFLKPYSRLMLKGGLALGPFETGDLAYLPRQLAEELDEKGFVEVLRKK